MNISRTIILLGFILSQTALFGQAVTEVSGFAPDYVGKKIELYEIQDYFSMREALLATTTVQPDSTFRMQFFNTKTQKVIIRSNKNSGFLYIEPKGKYEVFVPSKNSYDVYRAQGNDVEISFLNMDSTNINYKILRFDKWVDAFLGTYFYRKNMDGVEFVTKLDTFKLDVEKFYETDTNFFFKTYIKFSIASLDEIQFRGARNRYEKFDFYIHNFPVAYDNDAYMSYISAFYENMFSRLSMEANNRVYLGLLKNSPSLIMRALSDEYTLKPKNTRLRELIMIKGLSEVFYTGDFPQTNILSVLDSVAKHSLFKANAVVAANMIYRLTELVPGAKAPDFLVETKNLSSYAKKHLYIQFYDPTMKESIKEMELLKPIYEKYKGDVTIISVCEQKTDLTRKQKDFVASIPWEHYTVPADHPILKAYNVQTFPTYVLIDAYGYIVAAPALGPKPNGQYETIDRTFFNIKKVNEGNK